MAESEFLISANTINGFIAFLKSVWFLESESIYNYMTKNNDHADASKSRGRIFFFKVSFLSVWSGRKLGIQGSGFCPWLGPRQCS